MSKGNSSNRKQGSSRKTTKKKGHIFAINEKTIQSTTATDAVATGEKSPNAQVVVPIPGDETDPAGVKVVGWRIVAQCVDPTVLFNIGTKFSKSVVLHVPVAHRDEDEKVVLSLIGATKSVYAVTFTRVTYYVVDTMSYVH